MAFLKRTLSSRPLDLRECLFFVKTKNDQQIQGAGIACAVEMVVRGKNKYFLLTCTDVKNKPGSRVFAHRCYRRSWFKPKQNSVEVGDCMSFENAKFCFIPLDCTPEKSLKLVKPENIGQISECSSYVITQSTTQKHKNTNLRIMQSLQLRTAQLWGRLLYGPITQIVVTWLV